MNGWPISNSSFKLWTYETNKNGYQCFCLASDHGNWEATKSAGRIVMYIGIGNKVVYGIHPRLLGHLCICIHKKFG